MRVGGELGQHAAHLAARDDVMAVAGDQRRGDKLMMQTLIYVLLRFAWQAFLFADARGGKRVTMNAVDLIKG
ncbi:hypothetical protein D3C75_1266740 [compost metagenome]